MLTTGEAARLCSVKPDTVLKWIKKGSLRAVRTGGGHYRIDPQDLAPLVTEPAPAVREAASETASVPLRCWEYLSAGGALREECRECVVYRVRAALCFQVADLACEVGHARQFCRTSCEECLYYQRVHGRTTNVLVITADDGMVQRLAAEAAEGVALRFARNGYGASAVIHEFRPAFVVVDEEVLADGETWLLECLASDARVPGVKVVVAAGPGNARQPAYANVAAVVVKPVEKNHILRVIRGFPVEPLAVDQRCA